MKKIYVYSMTGKHEFDSNEEANYYVELLQKFNEDYYISVDSDSHYGKTIENVFLKKLMNKLKVLN